MSRSVLHTLLCGASLVLVASSIEAQAAGSTLSLGNELLLRHDLTGAASAYRAALRSGDSLERVGAHRALALVAWRYEADFASAARHLDSAFAVGSDSARTYIDASRFELARADFPRASLAAERAVRTARTSDERRLAARAVLRALIEPVIARHVDGVTTTRLTDTATLGSAVRSFSGALEGQIPQIDDASTGLLAALVANDGARALSFWRSYFLVDLPDSSYGAMDRARRDLPALLDRLSPRMSRSDRERLMTALADSRLYVAAALVARQGETPVTSARGAEIVAYAAFMRRMERAVDDYYRRLLHGTATPDQLTRAHVRLVRTLWPRLAWPNGQAPRFYPARALSELERRFGAVLYFGRTAGYFDLHYGHVISEQTRTIEQYGRRATVRYVVLDGMVSNGFQSWAWDGHTAHGGWQSGTTIYQVRPVFTDNPVAMWRAESDSSLRAAEAAAIAADSAADWVRAARDSAGFLPGVVHRLVRDARAALLDSLRRSGVADTLLAGAFLRAWANEARESAVFAHEGRHAIDRSLGAMSADALEFDAKLSEIAFSRRPKLALGPIVHADIGAPTPHGRANARIMLGFIAWMRAHRGEIAGLEVGRPMLPQLPLLSDEQIRRAARAMDPLAR